MTRHRVRCRQTLRSGVFDKSSGIACAEDQPPKARIPAVEHSMDLCGGEALSHRGKQFNVDVV